MQTLSIRRFDPSSAAPAVPLPSSSQKWGSCKVVNDTRATAWWLTSFCDYLRQPRRTQCFGAKAKQPLKRHVIMQLEGLVMPSEQYQWLWKGEKIKTFEFHNAIASGPLTFDYTYVHIGGHDQIQQWRRGFNLGLEFFQQDAKLTCTTDKNSKVRCQQIYFIYQAIW